ncbi:MAG: hypothetical protein IKD31_05290 [Clostridia bacterium]|nr:hypothetical protein [Clostridia bacterium]
MSRNFAQLLFWAFALWLYSVSRRELLSLLRHRLGRQRAGLLPRRGLNRYLFLTLRAFLEPALFYANAAALLGLAFSLVFHLIPGWFAFFGGFSRYLSSVLLLGTALLALVLTLRKRKEQFGTPFVLYARVRRGREEGFVSSLTDAALLIAAPCAMIYMNFFVL